MRVIFEYIVRVLRVIKQQLGKHSREMGEEIGLAILVFDRGQLSPQVSRCKRHLFKQVRW